MFKFILLFSIFLASLQAYELADYQIGFYDSLNHKCAINDYYDLNSSSICYTDLSDSNIYCFNNYDLILGYYYENGQCKSIMQLLGIPGISWETFNVLLSFGGLLFGFIFAFMLSLLSMYAARK